MMKNQMDDVVLLNIHKNQKDKVRLSRRIKALKRQEKLTLKSIKIGERKMRDKEKIKTCMIDECMTWCETSEQAEYFVDFVMMAMIDNIDPAKASEICKAKYNPVHWVVVDTKDQVQMQ